MDRFQRFQSGSRTAEPGRPDTGSQPIGLEPEPVPVMADIRKPIGSKTGTPAEGSRPGGRSGSPAVSPRLLNLRQMAEYLGCSYWTARDWVLAGAETT